MRVRAMPSLASSFGERFHNLCNEELLALAVQRDEMLEAASLALQQELNRRALGQDAIQQFIDQHSPPLSDATEESGESQPDTQVELPDNWFDEEEDDTKDQLPPSVGSRRPKGVTIAAFQFCLFAAGSLYFATIGVAIRGVVTTIVSLALSIAYLITALGLWQLRPWARKSAIVLLWTGVALTAAEIVLTAILRLRGFEVDTISTIYRFAGFVWQVLWVLYLGGRTVRNAFEIQTREAGS